MKNKNYIVIEKDNNDEAVFCEGMDKLKEHLLSFVDEGCEYEYINSNITVYELGEKIEFEITKPNINFK